MHTTKIHRQDESGLSLIEAMVSIAILSFAALAIGGVLTMSFRQTNSAEQVLNAQTYGMATAVAGTYSTASYWTNDVSIDTSATASVSSVPEVVVMGSTPATTAGATGTTVSVTTAPVTSSANVPSWWLS
ncbi:type IV pilus modification PilV family protein [Acidithiobacillus albertensis]|uniref:type IV pilus modification PilV family protein n=1 Tax=Acidithiobacillus albertensis TaxID=119978 RepID=UPI001C06D0CA|nr:type II secretion system protein [Acidithiobacillus albertensis]MBU2743173.1 type II secretion system protein [Acidithiobacillus albertensis]